MQQVFIVRTVYFNQLVTMPLHSSCRLCLRYMSRTQLATYKAWKTCHLHTHANIDGWSLYRPELFLERGGWAVLGIACGRVSNVSCVQPYPWQKEWGDVKSGFKNNTPAMHNLLRLWVFSVLFHRDRSSWGKIWCIRPVPMRITSKQYPRVFLLGQVFDDDATILFGFWYLLVKDSKTIKKTSNKNILHSSCSEHFVGPEESCHIYSGQCNAACLWDRAGSSPHIAASLIKNTSQQTLLTTSVQARKITTKHDNCSKACDVCHFVYLKFCHALRMSHGLTPRKLCWRLFDIRVLVVFVSVIWIIRNHLHVFDWPSIRPPVHTSSDLCQVRSKSKQIKL